MTDQPQPGASLSMDDVKLLKAGDWLKSSHTVHRVTHADATGLLLQHGALNLAEIEAVGFTFLGRPIDADGWIAHHGGPNPAPGMRVDYLDGWKRSHTDRHTDIMTWTFASGPCQVIHWKPHVPAPASNGGTDHKDEGREAVARAIADGFDNGNLRWAGQTEAMRDRFLMAADSVIALRTHGEPCAPVPPAGGIRAAIWAEILKLVPREERLGGQTFKYVKLADVLDIVGER